MKSLNFFIERPVTATVLNVMLIVCGVLAFRGLLIDEYPRVIVPKVKVETTFRNASAETVEKEITAPIEEAMSLVEGVESISSASKNGVSEVRLRFSAAVSMDRAVMQVSEQLARIVPTLPDDVDPPQIKRGEERAGSLIYLGVRSKSLSGSALTHFARTKVKSHFQGIDGVAEVDVWGAPFAMNITLDALAMHSQRIGPHQIIKTLKQNELLLQAGRMRTNEPISLDVVAKDPEDYRRMIVGKNGDVPVLLGDIAKVNLISDDKEQKIRIDGQNAIIIGISKTPDGNTLAVSDEIYKMVDKVNAELRGEAEVTVESDHSVFVRASLNSIFRTILEACVLVILIIFLFLRHLRATLVPLVTIPISLIATFFAIKLFGLSINTITLLAMVLAVGLVVDDAIVVLENIFRYREAGMNALDAARKGAEEIGFAIVAMTCTLMSVFLPLVFVADITGTILREFAITLASAVLFSGVVALTLSPLMCAHLLKHEPKEGRIGTAIENAIKATERFYLRVLEKAFRFRIWVFASMFLLLAGGIFLFTKLDANLLPSEDRGIIGAAIPAVAGFDLDDLEPYVAKVEKIFLEQEGIERSIVFGFGDSFHVVSVLKPWAQRPLHADKIVATLRERVAEIPTVNVYPWSWNIGLSALEDEGQDGAGIAIAIKSVGTYEELEAVSQKLADVLIKDGVLKDARSDLNMNEKAYSIKMLREPLAALDIDEKTVSLALQTYASRVRSSEFKLDGQRYHVFLETDVPTTDLNSIYIATSGEPVPLSTIARVKNEVQAPVLKHLNQMRTATVFASLAEGQSLSQAKTYLDKVVQENVPKEFAVSFEGALAMQKKTGQTFLLLFFAGLVFIFAVMAIQFEGVIDPLIILFTVPLACIGGVLVLWLSKTGTNLYTQVGMLTLIGLITKHGILLTEFVGQQRRAGTPLKDAIFLAARLRYRPIVMTTAATVLGAVPLIISRGAGVEARESIGLVIVGGMIFGTILTLFVLPSVIYSVHSLWGRWRKS